MATIYRGSGKRNTEWVIANHKDVQDELELRAWEIALRAEASLTAHKANDHAEILMDKGDIDHYVILDDSRGLLAALSIEFGRAGYIDPNTGQEYGSMEPLYILTNAANLSRRRTKFVRKRRKRFKKGG